MQITLKHPDTSNTRNLKVGWSWTLFFFSNIYGIPLFLRGLRAWGWFMFCLAMLEVIRNFYSPNAVNFLDYALIISSVLCAILFGLKGNDLTLKQWQKNGWVVAQNQSKSEHGGQIHFRCPSCQTKYTAITQQAGKEGKCKKCASLIKVPPQKEHSDFERPHLEVIQLRSKAIEKLSMDDVKEMVTRNDFYDSNISRLGEGIQHDYELLNREMVIDHITGLTWQQGGSNKNMTFEQAHKYVQDLNNKKYAGYSNWHLPTLEEAMSLVENKNTTFERAEKFVQLLKRKYAAGSSDLHLPTPEVATVMVLHIDPIFDRKQWIIWTADKPAPSSAWALSFDHGGCHYNDLDGYSFKVRAVRC